MNLKEVHRVLNEFFAKELTNGRKRHIVFWYDEGGEFVDDIDEVDVQGVRKWKITPDNLFATKYELEKNAPDEHFLLYANMPRPNPREDWLLDLYKVAFEFATDKLTVIIRELGITDDTLRETFKAHRSFFNSKARLQAFTKFPIDSYTHEIIDITVLTALTKSRTNTMDEIIKALMRSVAEDDSRAWDDIQKYECTDLFWRLVEKYYGYTSPEKTLKSLLIFFMVTHNSQQNQDMKFPESWDKYMASRPMNVVVFMDQWMNHLEDRCVYNMLADRVAEMLNVNHYAGQWDPVRDMASMDAFRVFDEKIIFYLVNQLTNGLTDFNTYKDIISARRKLHWYPEYHNEYEAIHHAVMLLAFMHERGHFIPEQDSEAMFEAYAEEYYQVDTAYRKFYVAYDRLEEKGQLHPLREMIENMYSNRFMEELAVKWTQSLERAEGNTWPIADLPQQNDFYRDWVQAYHENENRVFVIISDALRYEAAIELMNELNKERKASTDIAAIQSVLPSYTALGMAALLPHKQLEFNGEGKVEVDGMSTVGTPNRNHIIQNAVEDGMAVKFNDIIRMNRTNFRETFQGKKVVYIYHNGIDARGDNASTEMEVFQAAEETINDIRVLVNKLVQNVSASNIVITADHGFMYQRDALTKSQKTPKHIDDALLAKRRFMITDEPVDVEGTLTYAMGDVREQDKDLFVTVPKGVSRFAVQGAGANFVHGGAMLQEIVVPVITFKNDRSRSSANKARKVDVKLTTPTRKITNTITYLTFLQTAKIEDKKLPLRLKLYFVDEGAQRVSNENIIIADSVSSQPGERTYREKFVFKSISYDKQKTYYLVLEDEEDRFYERYPFHIDITFSEGYRY